MLPHDIFVRVRTAQDGAAPGGKMFTMPSQEKGAPSSGQMPPPADQPAEGKADAGRSSYHHGNLRATLIESGKELLEAKGVPAFSLRLAARTAGVSQTAPYHHFTDKDGLLDAISADGFQRLGAELEAAAHGGIRPMVLAFLRFARANPQMFRLMFAAHPASRPRTADLAAAFERCWAACMGATRRELGDNDDTSDRARQATLAVWSGMYGLSRLLEDGTGAAAGLDDRSAAESVVQILQRGIGALANA